MTASNMLPMSQQLGETMGTAGAMILVLVTIIAVAVSAQRRRRRVRRSTPRTTSWTVQELRAVQRANQAHIELITWTDGRVSGAFRIPVAIIDGDVLVRDLEGSASAWFQLALDHGVGVLVLDGRERLVRLQVADWALGLAVDDAFEDKYPELTDIGKRSARSGTLRVDPLLVAKGDLVRAA